MKRPLHTFPLLRRVIKRWLKAGVMENGAWFPTEEGTPQGGVCSPLLANIAGRLFGRIGTVASMRP
jgi:RNA-directed DNA polymerase